MDTTYRYTWTRKGVAAFGKGTTDPAHTISEAPWPEGFVRQNRAGVPWLIADQAGKVILRGTGPTGCPWSPPAY